MEEEEDGYKVVTRVLDPDVDVMDWSSISIPEAVSKPWQTWANEILTHFAECELEPKTSLDEDFFKECESICKIKNLKEAFQLASRPSMVTAHNQSLNQLANWILWNATDKRNRIEFKLVQESSYQTIGREFFLESGPQSKFAKIALDNVPVIGSSRGESQARRKRKRKVNLFSYFESKRNDGASNLCSR
jgi:hypothetical protein